MCVALNIHLHKEKFKSDDYSYTHWWIDPSNLFSKTSSWVVLFQVLLDVNCCALIYLFWTYIYNLDIRNGCKVGPCLDTTYTVMKVEFRNFEIYELRQRLLQQSSFSIQTAASSQMLFNPYTCWGINTGTRLYHVRSGWYRSVSIEMRSQKTRATSLICQSNFKIP